MRMAVPFIMQNANKKRKIVVLSCPQLSFKMKKTTGDNFGQLINNEWASPLAYRTLTGKEQLLFKVVLSCRLK